MQLPGSGPQRSNTLTLAVAGLLALCAAYIVVVITGAAEVLPLGGDARAYFAAARAIMSGQSPVGANGAQFLPEAGESIPDYLYPPFLALALVPLASLPYPAALYIWLALATAMTLLLVYALHRRVGWKVALIGVLFFLPTWESLWLGQINALIAVLLAVALSKLDQRQEGQLGVALALGTLLKVTPVLGVLMLAMHRRWRSIGFVVMTLASIVVLSLPLVPFEIWYSGSLYALRSTETNAYLLSWTAILRSQPAPISVIGPPAVTVGMLAITVLRSPFVSLRLSLTAAFILPLLISGIIWHYTAILALPALAVLWQYNLRARLLALTTWTTISLIGGLWQPTLLTLCWCVCCWPQLLGPESPPQGVRA